MHGHYYGTGWFIFGLLMMIAFWLIVAAIVYFIVRKTAPSVFRQQEEKKPTENGALKILRERYAKGELSKEEYERMKKDLEK